MNTTKQATSLSVKNIDLFIGDSEAKTNKHSELLPNSIRGIICGPSNCGKTNVIISLLTDPNGLKFENVYIYSKSLYQPKYKYLEAVFSFIKEIKLFMFNHDEHVITTDEVKPNSVFIFDDVIHEKQNYMKSYFCMGRHKGIDCFYLSQSYAHIPKHLIRENTNLIVLFKQDENSLKHVFSDFNVSSDMNFKRFLRMCYHCWSEKYSFLVINTDCDIHNGKYRCGFDNFITIDQHESC